MLTFLRLTLVVFVVCAASAGVSHWLAVQQPMPIMAAFTNPDGTPCEHPCLFGVQPGLTSFDQAGELLRAHPFTRQFEPNLEGDIFQLGDMRVIIAWGLGDDRVSSIELFTTSRLDWGSLGQIIAVLGPPEGVLVDGDYTHSFWRARHLEFIHTCRQAGYLTPSDALDSIYIRAQPNSILHPVVGWQGFSTIERYHAAKP